MRGVANSSLRRESSSHFSTIKRSLGVFFSPPSLLADRRHSELASGSTSRQLSCEHEDDQRTGTGGNFHRVIDDGFISLVQRSFTDLFGRTVYLEQIREIQLHNKLNFNLLLFIVGSLKGGCSFIVGLLDLYFWWTSFEPAQQTQLLRAGPNDNCPSSPGPPAGLRSHCTFTSCTNIMTSWHNEDQHREHLCNFTDLFVAYFTCVSRRRLSHSCISRSCKSE